MNKLLLFGFVALTSFGANAANTRSNLSTECNVITRYKSSPGAIPVEARETIVFQNYQKGQGSLITGHSFVLTFKGKNVVINGLPVVLSVSLEPDYRYLSLHSPGSAQGLKNGGAITYWNPSRGNNMSLNLQLSDDSFNVEASCQ